MSYEPATKTWVGRKIQEIQRDLARAGSRRVRAWDSLSKRIDTLTVLQEGNQAAILDLAGKFQLLERVTVQLEETQRKADLERDNQRDNQLLRIEALEPRLEALKVHAEQMQISTPSLARFNELQGEMTCWRANVDPRLDRTENAAERLEDLQLLAFTETTEDRVGSLESTAKAADDLERRIIDLERRVGSRR